MTITQGVKFALFLFVLLSVSACGLAEQGDECDNPHPSQKARCDAEKESEKSEWNNMNWNDGTWG